MGVCMCTNKTIYVPEIIYFECCDYFISPIKYCEL